MNKEAASLFLSPSPGSFYFKSTSLWLIFKMLFSSCIFLLKNHSGSPGKYEQLGQHSASCAQSLPSSTLTCNFHSSQGSLLASLLPGSMSFSILHTFLEHPLTPSFQWFCLSFNALKSSMAYFMRSSVCQSTLLPLCGELLSYHTMTLNHSMVAWRSMGHVQIPAL